MNPSYRVIPPHTDTFQINDSVEGETMESRIQRIMNNNEPLITGDAGPQIYTDRSDGVLPETNIRTDRFDATLDKADKIHKQQLQRRADFQEKIKQQATPTDKTPPTT